jgi:DNA segregation ATPase FtsK/SpoIIIE, S-DNA-T family
MPTSTKKRKPKASEPTKLKQEKEEKVDVKQLLKDERTHKILGSVFLLLAFLLFTAFTSYIFTWSEDQDKVSKGAKILLPGHDEPVGNLLGSAGAYISHVFFRLGFGIASYLICSFFFIAGVNLFFGRKLFSLSRNIKYVILGLIVVSVGASFVMKGSGFPWGGAVGDMINEWLQKLIGRVGTAALLLIAGLAYIIWRFNPVFSLPQNEKVSEYDREEEPEVLNQKSAAVSQSAEKLYIEDDLNHHLEIVDAKKNTLKGEGAMLEIPSQDNPALNHDLKIVEKEPEPEKRKARVVNAVSVIPPPEIDPPLADNTRHVVTIPPAPEVIPPAEPKTTTKKEQQPAENLELEIKQVSQEVEEDESESASKVAKLEPYDPILDLRGYKLPSIDLLEAHGSENIVKDPAELEANKNQIINTLKNYDIAIQKISATVGPTVTLYEIVPAAGVRISRIKNLEDDIALSLAALGIRIIAPIPGKGTIGIEVPNVKKTVVSMRTLISSEKFAHNNFSLPIAIGKKIDNENFIVDLTTMPHLLMAGATGQGKSVGLNAILVSLLYKKHPSQLKFVLVDPKKVELSIYRVIEKHFLAKLPGEDEAIITDTKKVIHTLNALCIEMDNRYDLLKEAGCRNIREYNEKFAARRLNPEKGHQFLPFIVLVVDEFADLIMTAGKEVEMPIARLAQLARAVGIHLIIATQRPSVNIITGTIKANFPARIAFKVSSKIDSRTILDVGGAEQLIGKGDMLISYNGELVRLQCAFVDTPEVDKIVDFIGAQKGYPQAFLLPEYVDEKEMESKDFDLSDKDPLFEEAARMIVSTQIGSTSLLQRRMKLGYNRAGRLMDQLEAAGVVGQSNGSKARDVLVKTEADLQMMFDSM